MKNCIPWNWQLHVSALHWIQTVNTNRCEFSLHICSLIFLSMHGGLLYTVPMLLPQVPWRVVASSMLIQFFMGLVILRWSAGASAIQWFADKLIGFLNFGVVGAEYVFGESFEDHFFAMAVRTFHHICSSNSSLYIMCSLCQSQFNDGISNG